MLFNLFVAFLEFFLELSHFRLVLLPGCGHLLIHLLLLVYLPCFLLSLGELALYPELPHHKSCFLQIRIHLLKVHYQRLVLAVELLVEFLHFREVLLHAQADHVVLLVGILHTEALVVQQLLLLRDLSGEVIYLHLELLVRTLHVLVTSGHRFLQAHDLLVLRVDHLLHVCIQLQLECFSHLLFLEKLQVGLEASLV